MRHDLAALAANYPGRRAGQAEAATRSQNQTIPEKLVSDRINPASDCNLQLHCNARILLKHATITAMRCAFFWNCPTKITRPKTLKRCPPAQRFSVATPSCHNNIVIAAPSSCVM
jgi:hypothetical protein